jgi:tetratricopeptide (TPR) repeat protein
MRLSKASLGFGFLLPVLAWSQTQLVVHHEANFEAERAQANQLFLQDDKLKALPLYQDLARQDPNVAVFAERMGSGLIAAADIEDDATKKQALNDQAVAAFRRAKALGDDSPLVRTMLGMEEDRQNSIAAAKNNQPISKPAQPQPNPLSSNPKALEWMHQGEIAFAKNDTATAFADYKKASEIDPTSYMARLYTGDACFRKGDYACAGEWFAKAIALDANRETAYRYWGDALFKSGHPQDAEMKYAQAIVAEPYSRLSWGGLTQWGLVTKTAISSPPIQRPTIAADGGGSKIAMPAALATASPEDISVWATYGACRAISEHNHPSGQRRTAEDETRCLQAAADYAGRDIAAGKVKVESLTPGVQSLIALQNAGMLECWVLLNGADKDVAQDFAAYRTAHRDLMISYIEKFVVHPGAGPTTGQTSLIIQK